jgi:hypothetical protein
MAKANPSDIGHNLFVGYNSKFVELKDGANPRYPPFGENSGDKCQRSAGNATKAFTIAGMI